MSLSIYELQPWTNFYWMWALTLEKGRSLFHVSCCPSSNPSPLSCGKFMSTVKEIAAFFPTAKSPSCSAVWRLNCTSPSLWQLQGLSWTEQHLSAKEHVELGRYRSWNSSFNYHPSGAGKKTQTWPPKRKNKSTFIAAKAMENNPYLCIGQECLWCFQLQEHYSGHAPLFPKNKQGALWSRTLIAMGLERSWPACHLCGKPHQTSHLFYRPVWKRMWSSLSQPFGFLQAHHFPWSTTKSILRHTFL